MIFKVQIPLNADTKQLALAYNEDRSQELFIPINQSLLDKMAGEPKKYFNAHIWNDSLILRKEVQEQDW